MFKKLRKTIEESDTVKKASDSTLGKYLTPSQQQSPSDLGSSVPPDSASSQSASSVSGRYASVKSRSRQSSIGSTVSEASSSAVVVSSAANAAGDAAAASPLESLSRAELTQRLLHAQSLARRYKTRLLEADNKLRSAFDCGDGPAAASARLAARDRLIEALKIQSSLLTEGSPVPADLQSDIQRAELGIVASDAVVIDAPTGDPNSQPRPNGDRAQPEDGSERQKQRLMQLEAEANLMKEQLAEKTIELEKQRRQILQLQQELQQAAAAAAAAAAAGPSNSSPDTATAALEQRLREAEAKLAATEQRNRDERAIAAEEAASARRRLKQQLAELQQQLAAREREAALKDSTGATRDSEIRTLKERLDSRLASERRLRDEAKARSAEAAHLAEQLRASRLEAEGLARQCREQQRQLEAGLAGQLEQLETEQADRLKTAAREFQDRLDAKERDFQAKFQEAVERFQEAESRARAAHRLETDELLQSLEAREVAEGRLNRRLESAESERAAAVAELAACQTAAAEEVDRLRADVADAEAGRLAAAAAAEELRAQLEAATAEAAAATAASAAMGGSAEANRCQSDALALLCRVQEAIRFTAGTASSDSAQLLNSLAEQVNRVRADAVSVRPAADSVSLEDYEAVKMYAADLQKQLMSVNAELAELRSRRAAQSARPPPPAASQEFASRSQQQQQQQQQLQQQQLQQQQSTAFTEIPEVAYLKNVLYKYMLGEKTQTLARVICTVLKFTDYQIQQVMDHEGRRAAQMHVQ